MPSDHRNASLCSVCGYRRYPFRGTCGVCRAELRAAGLSVSNGKQPQRKVPVGYEAQHEARILAEIARVEREDPELRRRREAC